MVKLHLTQKNENLFFESFINNVQKARLSNSINIENLLKKIYYGELIGKSVSSLRAGKLDPMPTSFTPKNLETKNEKETVFKITEKFFLNYPSLNLIVSVVIVVVLIVIILALMNRLENAKKLIKVKEAQFKFTEFQKASCNAQRLLELTKNQKQIEILEKTNMKQSERLKSLTEKINRICDTKNLDGECPKTLEKLKKGIKKNPKKNLLDLPEYTDLF